MITDAGALHGVRILDFTNLLAGPFPSLLCGFLGAQVIKVESWAQLDAARRTPYARDNPDNSPAFNSINVNKLSVQLNLKEPKAVTLVHRLTAISDVVVENMRPGVMERLGLGYQQLSRINSGIIMASISAAGSAGPESSYPGYAPAFNALSGLGHMTGYADGPPGELHDSLDARVGSTAAFAILSALFHRLRTGRGQLIDVSSRESITMACAEALMDYTMNGRVTHRRGNQEEAMSPHGCYRCEGEDAWLTVAVGNQQDWEGLCRATGHPEWMLDPRFADTLLRYTNRDALDGLLESWTQQHSPELAAVTLQGYGVAAAPSMSGRDLLKDPHLGARGVWQEVEHPIMGVQLVPGPPWRLSETPATIRSPGPLLGQQNHWTLVELLGEPPEQVEKWVEQGIVY